MPTGVYEGPQSSFFLLPKPNASGVVSTIAPASRATPRIRRFIPKPPLTGLRWGMTATSLQRYGPKSVGKIRRGEPDYPNRPRLPDDEQTTGHAIVRQRKLHGLGSFFALGRSCRIG